MEFVKMKKTFKFRIFPSKSNISKLNNIIELCRFVYNRGLSFKINQYKRYKKSYTKFDMDKWITTHRSEKPELKSVYTQVLQNTMTRLDEAYRGFFRRIKANGEKAGFPRFQGEGRYNSFTFPQFGFKTKENMLYISKIGWVRANFHREIEGKIKQLTITRSLTDKWYACFICEIDQTLLKPNKKAVGIDLGITSFTTDSDGNKVDYPRHYEKAQSNLARLQRKLEHSKKKKERTKVKKALRLANEKVVNKRKNFLHKTSRKLVNDNGAIAFEKLNIKALQQKHWVSKQISDASWATFTKMVSYKAEWAGRKVVFVNPAYTSQTCSNCGEIVRKKLSDRIHHCNCGLEIDRDHNAAINILTLGLESLEGSPS